MLLPSLRTFNPRPEPSTGLLLVENPLWEVVLLVLEEVLLNVPASSSYPLPATANAAQNAGDKCDEFNHDLLPPLGGLQLQLHLYICASYPWNLRAQLSR